MSLPAASSPDMQQASTATAMSPPVHDPQIQGQSHRQQPGSEYDFGIKSMNSDWGSEGSQEVMQGESTDRLRNDRSPSSPESTSGDRDAGTVASTYHVDDRFASAAGSADNRRRGSESSTISLGIAAATPLAEPTPLRSDSPPSPLDVRQREGSFDASLSNRTRLFGSSPPRYRDDVNDDASDSLPSSPLSSASMPASFLSSMSENEDGDDSLAASRQLSGRGTDAGPIADRSIVRNLNIDDSIRLPPSWIVSTDSATLPRRMALERRTTAVQMSVVRPPPGSMDSPEGPAPAGVSSSTTDPKAPTGTTTSSYIFSRAHWAVEEARRRTEEQGEDLSLVLPSLTLPADSVEGGGQSATREARSEIAPQDDFSGVTPGLSAGTRGSDAPRHRPQHVLLCGTNRTVNAFLKQLLREPSVDVYRLRSPGRSSSSSSRRSSGFFDVGVFLKREQENGARGSQLQPSTPARAAPPPRSASSVEDSTADESDGGSQRPARRPTMLHVSSEDARWSSGMVLLAVIHVVGKGQVGNVQRAVDSVESSYKRLDRLLTSSINLPPSVEQDLTNLIEMWAARSLDEGLAVSRSMSPTPHWYDFGVVTGDARYLADQESDQLRHLTDILPCICWPSSLQTRLGFTDRNSPFMKLASNGSDHHPLQHGFAPDSLAPLISMLRDAQTSSNMLEQSVTGFLRYRQFIHDVPRPTSPPSISSTPAETATSSRSPEWEAGLSRRHAAHLQTKPSPGPIASAAVTELGVFAHRSVVRHPMRPFFDEEEMPAPISRSRPSFIAMFLAPLWSVRAALGLTSKATDEQRSLLGGWLGVACLTVATAGIAYWSLVTWT